MCGVTPEVVPANAAQRQRSLADARGPSLADAIRDQIVDGQLSPGARLSEARLAAQFAVSRNTLREAFRVLSEQGLLEHVLHRGVSVTSPDAGDVVDIYRVRRALECGALAKANPRHRGVTVMADAVGHGESAAEAGDWHTAGSANMAFHEAIVALADSPRLDRSYRNVSAELRLAFLEIDDMQGLHEPFVGRNRQILDCFVAEGAAPAAALLEEYLTASERMVLGAISRHSRG